MLKVLRMSSGLGNQMYKYAFYLALKDACKEDAFCFDKTQFIVDPAWNGYELEKLFQIQENDLFDLLPVGKREICMRKIHEISLLKDKKKAYKLMQKLLFSTMKKEFDGCTIIGQPYYTLPPALIDINQRAVMKFIKQQLKKHDKLFEKIKGILSSSKLPYDITVRPSSIKTGDTKFRDTILKTQGNAYYYGHWENADFWFHHIEDTVKSKFCFSPFTDSKNMQFVDEMQNQNTVAVHFRRGDALGLNFKLYESHYYPKAIQHIKAHIMDPIFVVFSDDITWCRMNFTQIGFAKDDRLVYVDWNTAENAYKDMQLMSICMHMIIGNSSFAFWGAYLSNNENKIVCAPFKAKSSNFVCIGEGV